MPMLTLRDSGSAVLVFILAYVGCAGICSADEHADLEAYQRVSLCEIASRPDYYHLKKVRFDADYLQGDKTTPLTKRCEGKGFTVEVEGLFERREHMYIDKKLYREFAKLAKAGEEIEFFGTYVKPTGIEVVSPDGILYIDAVIERQHGSTEEP